MSPEGSKKPERWNAAARAAAVGALGLPAECSDLEARLGFLRRVEESRFEPDPELTSAFQQITAGHGGPRDPWEWTAKAQMDSVQRHADEFRERTPKERREARVKLQQEVNHPPAAAFLRILEDSELVPGEADSHSDAAREWQRLSLQLLSAPPPKRRPLFRSAFSKPTQWDLDSRLELKRLTRSRTWASAVAPFLLEYGNQNFNSSISKSADGKPFSLGGKVAAAILILVGFLWCVRHYDSEPRKRDLGGAQNRRGVSESSPTLPYDPPPFLREGTGRLTAEEYQRQIEEIRSKLFGGDSSVGKRDEDRRRLTEELKKKFDSLKSKQPNR